MFKVILIRHPQTSLNCNLSASDIQENQNKHAQIRTPTLSSVSSNEEQTYRNLHPCKRHPSWELACSRGGQIRVGLELADLISTNKQHPSLRARTLGTACDFKLLWALRLLRTSYRYLLLSLQCHAFGVEGRSQRRTKHIRKCNIPEGRSLACSSFLWSAVCPALIRMFCIFCRLNMRKLEWLALSGMALGATHGQSCLWVIFLWRPRQTCGRDIYHGSLCESMLTGLSSDWASSLPRTALSNS